MLWYALFSLILKYIYNNNKTVLLNKQVDGTEDILDMTYNTENNGLYMNMSTSYSNCSDSINSLSADCAIVPKKRKVCTYIL